MKRAIELARELRRNQTQEEKKLWNILRNRKFLGKKFVRQHPVYYQSISDSNFFIVDFYCHEKKLVVEIDGGYHDFQKDFDQNRDQILKAMGLIVLRIRNSEFDDIVNVLEKIRNYF
jgi:very-short-patch-repair endonuclease